MLKVLESTRPQENLDAWDKKDKLRVAPNMVPN